MSGAPNWQETARRLLAERACAPWEIEFLHSIAARATLSERQQAVLSRIETEPGAAEIAAMLAERIEQLAPELAGEPTHKGRREWRFFPRGGLAIEVAGDRRGIWHEFSSGKGGDALDLVGYLRGGELADAIKWARGWLGRPERTERTVPTARTARPEPVSTLSLARRIWAEAADPAGSPAEIYLRSRGLSLPADAPIRFHPDCPRGDERHPVMIALMTGPVTAEPCGVHRTFLQPDGRGKIEHGSVKMMTGRAGVIRLAPGGEVTLGLGIAEGIETALAIMQHTQWRPVWACASAGGIAKFPVLDGIECITIFADRDDSGAGLAAAKACAARWIAAGREATIELPPDGTDWLDALMPRRAA